MHRRMVRSGLPFGTALQATYLHPYGSDEFKPMLGGRLHAQDPGDEVKRYYTYRNRGYLMSQPGMRRIGLLELPRFAWYFLVTKRDPGAFRDWLTLLRQGRREQFHRAPDHPHPLTVVHTRCTRCGCPATGVDAVSTPGGVVHRALVGSGGAAVVGQCHRYDTRDAPGRRTRPGPAKPAAGAGVLRRRDRRAAA